MTILLAAAGLLAARLGWIVWLTFVMAFLPAFVLGHVIGEYTFGIQCWLHDRRSGSYRGSRKKPQE